MYILETLHGNIPVNLSDSHEIVGSFKKFPHWGWWVFWLIVCWPVMFILAVMGMNDDVLMVKFGEKDIIMVRENDFNLYLAHRVNI